MTAGEDVYVSMQEVDMTSGWTQLSLYINPLINWIWIGCVLMALGGFLAVLDRRYRKVRVLRKQAAPADNTGAAALAGVAPRPSAASAAVRSDAAASR